MSASELLERIRSLPAGSALDWARVREDIHDEFDRAEAESDRALLLGIFKATMDAVERQIQPADLEKFRETRRQDYNLLIVKECLIGENVCTEVLDSVTKREIAAGRMSPDDSMRKTAEQGMAAPHLSREDLIVIACVKHARDLTAKQMPSVQAAGFDFMPIFLEQTIQLYQVGLMWRYGEQFKLPNPEKLPSDSRERAFACLHRLLIEEGVTEAEAKKKTLHLYQISRAQDGKDVLALSVGYEAGNREGALVAILNQFRGVPLVSGSPYRMLDKAKPISLILGVAVFALVLILGRSFWEAVGAGVVVALAGLAIALAIYHQTVRVK